MGLFEPSVNLEKEEKLIEKYSPYEWIKAWFKYTYDKSFYWDTHFRIAEKGIVFYQATDSGADLRIIDFSNGTQMIVRLDPHGFWRRDMIHWLRGVSRIIESNMGSVEYSDG
nr:hypothetical protein [uncultured Methanobrevibacter sp.]